jgi:hypothetical protein
MERRSILQKSGTERVDRAIRQAERQALETPLTDAGHPGRWAPMGHILAVAAVLVLADAAKPLHIDDPAYYYNARHLAQNPTHPYAFDIFWYEYPESANAVLAPPVLLYWWSLAIRLFGNDVVLWKLWLFPFGLAFAWSLERLFRRFARGLEIPLLWMTALSPTFLPSFNLMPDVPALALALLAIVIFLEALDRTSYAGAVAAGLLAALAMQTKYTAFTAPAVMIVAALLGRRPVLGLLAALVAGAGFCAWEVFLYYQQGSSHFLFALGLGDAIRRRDAPQLALPLITCIGCVGPAIALMAWVGLGAPTWAVAAGALGTVLGLCLIALQNWQWPIFKIMGGASWASFAAVAWCLLRWPRGTGSQKSRSEWFLLAWLIIELTAYFTISPFPAVRRIMGIVVVLSLLTGRLAARTANEPLPSHVLREALWSSTIVVVACASMKLWEAGVGALAMPALLSVNLAWPAAISNRVKLSHWIAVGGVALGVGFGALDWWDARVRAVAARDILARIRQHDPTPAAMWFTGHWGFQYYAEQAGMRPVIADGTMLHKGDWLVYTLGGQDTQMIWLPPGSFGRVFEMTYDDAVPLTTQHLYLGGAPLDHRDGPRVKFGVGRMNVDYTASTLLPPDLLVRWAAERNRPLPPAAIPSILRAIDQLRDKGTQAITSKMWLARLAQGDEPALREAAARALRSIEAKQRS